MWEAECVVCLKQCVSPGTICCERRQPYAVALKVTRLPTEATGTVAYLQPPSNDFPMLRSLGNFHGC